MATKKPLYICQILLMFVAFCVATISVSCSRPQRYAKIISDAERIVNEYPDSALAILAAIDPAEITVDSVKAQYYLTRASIHSNLGHLELSDSLIRYSADYYRDKDMNRAVMGATLSALFDYWVVGNRNAITRLDSLSAIDNLPDSLAIFPLRKRAYWSTKLFYEDGNRPVIKRLISIEKDSAKQQLYKYWLYTDYLFDQQNDSALVVLNELIDQAIRTKSSADQFKYEYEKVGLLEEMGNYSECLDLADKFLKKAPGNSIEHYIHLWKSLAYFNQGNSNLAIQELSKADSCASYISESEKNYYNSFSFVLKTTYDFKTTGRLRLIDVAEFNNRQKNNMLRMQYLQQELERNALINENRKLILKAKNERADGFVDNHCSCGSVRFRSVDMVCVK